LRLPLSSQLRCIFALAWGYDGLRILTSPSCGLEDVWRSQLVSFDLSI
jgi:hypothetical protein